MTFQSILTPTQSAQAVTMVANGMSKAAVAREFGVSVRTIYRLFEEKPEKPPKKLKPCGTNAAYQRHRRKGERCPICWTAHALSVKGWKRRNGKVQGL